jgi:hypothetical protein
MASIFAQVLLFFVLVYFAAFSLEALSFAGLPPPGTLTKLFTLAKVTRLTVRCLDTYPSHEVFLAFASVFGTLRPTVLRVLASFLGIVPI